MALDGTPGTGDTGGGSANSTESTETEDDTTSMSTRNSRLDGDLRAPSTPDDDSDTDDGGGGATKSDGERGSVDDDTGGGFGGGGVGTGGSGDGGGSGDPTGGGGDGGGGGGATKSGGERGSVDDDTGGDDTTNGGDGSGGDGGGGATKSDGERGSVDGGTSGGEETEAPAFPSGEDRTGGPGSMDSGDDTTSGGTVGGVRPQDTPEGRQAFSDPIPNPIKAVQFGDDTTEASDVSTQIEAQTDLEAGRDFTVERGDDAFGIEYTSEYFQRQYAEDYDQRYEGVEVEAGDVEVVRTEEDGDSVVSPELDTDTQREIAAAELDEDYSQISITLEDVTGIEDTEDGGTRPVLSQEAEDRIIESETASQLGVSLTDVEVEQGQLRAETSRGAAALAESQLNEQTSDLENVTVDELVPGVVEASGDPTGGEVAAPGQQSTTVASEAGRDLLADLADYSDERADLRSDALESRRVEAGVQARADAAAGEEAVDITRTVFDGATGAQADDATTASVDAAPEQDGVGADTDMETVPGVGEATVGPGSAGSQFVASGDVAADADSTTPAIDTAGNIYADVAGAADFLAGGVDEAVGRRLASADYDDVVADAATSGGFSRLPLPTVKLDELAEDYNQRVEETSIGLTTVNAETPFGTIPVSVRQDPSKEETEADTPAMTLAETGLMAVNPAGVLEDVENIAEAADNPGVYLRNPAGTVESTGALARDTIQGAETLGRERPFQFLSAGVIGLGGTAAGGVSALRGSGSVSRSLAAEVDPRVGPLGTTLETRAVRGARDRLSRLPFPDDERGSMQLGKFRRRDVDPDDAGDVDELGVPDDPFLESDKRLKDPARSFDGENTPSTDIDPTDPSRVSEQDIRSGIAGEGDPQAAPGTTFEWNPGTDVGAAGASRSGRPATAGVLFGEQALDQAGQPSLTQDTMAAGNIDTVRTLDFDTSIDAGSSVAATAAVASGTDSTIPFGEDVNVFDTDTDIDSDATDTGADIDTRADTDTELDVDQRPDTDTRPDTDVGPDIDTRPDTDTRIDTDTDQDVDQRPDQDTDTPSDVDTRSPDVDTRFRDLDPQDVDVEDVDARDIDPYDADPTDYDVPLVDPPKASGELDDLDDRRRSKRSRLFANPTISPSEALDYTPLDDDSDNTTSLDDLF